MRLAAAGITIGLLGALALTHLMAPTFSRQCLDEGTFMSMRGAVVLV